MSLQRLPPKIGRPRRQKSHAYQYGWRLAVADWWKFFKPKRGTYRHLTEIDMRHKYKKKIRKAG